LGSTGIEQAIEHVVKDSDSMSLLDIIVSLISWV
jgi:hypothetical protein